LMNPLDWIRSDGLMSGLRFDFIIADWFSTAEIGQPACI
jgi:hypothetical protein